MIKGDDQALSTGNDTGFNILEHYIMQHYSILVCYLYYTHCVLFNLAVLPDIMLTPGHRRIKCNLHY